MKLETLKSRTKYRTKPKGASSVKSSRSTFVGFVSNGLQKGAHEKTKWVFEVSSALLIIYSKGLNL